MNNDSKLHQALRAWQVSPSPDADFNTAVWRRVAAEEERGWAGAWTRLGDWLLVQLPRPAYASALLGAAALIGLTTASVQASRARENDRVEHARQYLNSIDPLAMSDQVPR
jgi:hypothetical protein